MQRRFVGLFDVVMRTKLRCPLVCKAIIHTKHLDVFYFSRVDDCGNGDGGLIVYTRE